MGNHAKYSPSKAHQWLRCGLSAHFAATMLDTPSEAAKRGTAMHEVAATCLLENANHKKVQPYLDTVRSFRGLLLVETRVEVIPDLCWGTVDAAVIGHDRAIIDFKWGTSPVDPIANPQLMLYAIGVRRHADALDHGKAAPWTLCIVQPNTSSGWPVKKWLTDDKALSVFAKKVEKAIERAERPDPPAMAGSHCHWCPGKMHCKEYKSLAASKKILRNSQDHVS